MIQSIVGQIRPTNDINKWIRYCRSFPNLDAGGTNNNGNIAASKRFKTIGKSKQPIRTNKSMLFTKVTEPTICLAGAFDKISTGTMYDFIKAQQASENIKINAADIPVLKCFDAIVI